MKLRRRDLASLSLAAVALLLGFLASCVFQTDRGLGLGVDGSRVVVTRVDPGSAASQLGLRVGMTVIEIDSSDVTVASQATLQAVLAADPIPDTLTVGWPGDGPAPVPASNLRANGLPIASSFQSYATVWLGQIDASRQQTPPVLGLGLAVLIAGWWWLGTGRGGAALRPLAVSLPVATAAPLLLLPLDRLPIPAADIATAFLVPLSMLPLAIDLCGLVPGGRLRRVVVAVCLALVLASAAASLAASFRVQGGEPIEPAVRALRIVLAAAVALVAGLAASVPLLSRSAESGEAAGSAPTPGRFLESTELVVASATPGIAAFSLGPDLFLWPIVAWLGAILVARRFTLRPLVGFATRARLQRDVVVAATEAERARIAADIHDEALQDLTLLVRRLDASGDAENAAAARAVAERLRAICGELRLPILDDLGLGPALEWLTERFEPIAGGAVYLERARDEQRLPPEVELAIFRIAQEALSNAVRHGRAPVTVRYRGGGTWAELDVDDQGPGIGPGDSERAQRSGHFGLLNMAQRAEQAGAELRIGRRPGGGTRVSVVWEAPVPATPPPGEAAPGLVQPRPAAGPSSPPSAAPNL